jgi:magnesium-transporting ATPase (P-type)
LESDCSEKKVFKPFKVLISLSLTSGKDLFSLLTNLRRYLWKLVLIEGRQNHLRVSNFIYLFLYKNIVFTSAQFILGFYCDWSAQTIYDDWYITLYNVLFTAFAISYLGAMDQDVRFREYCTKEELRTKKEFPDPIINELGEI